MACRFWRNGELSVFRSCACCGTQVVAGGSGCCVCVG